MGHRAEPSGIHLTEMDAAVAKGMLDRGDRQHDVAAWFGVNAGRIAEIAAGRRFAWVTPIYTSLPPPGPYPIGRQSIEAKAALDKALAALVLAETALIEATKS